MFGKTRERKGDMWYGISFAWLILMIIDTIERDTQSIYHFHIIMTAVCLGLGKLDDILKELREY